MSDEQSLPLPRRRRGVRLLVVAWERLAEVASVANELGLQTRRREVLDALIETHAPGSGRRAADLVREYRLTDAQPEARVMRDLRLLESSWETVKQTVEATNARGMAVRDREVIEALVIRYAPTDAKAAASLVRAHRIRHYGDDAPPRVRA